MIQDFFLPFLAIGVAELGDKTQIAILCLATQTRKHLLLFFGILLAFFVTDGIAVIQCELKNPFLTGFGVIFVSELGDKTQIAAGLFATKYQPVLVLAGVITALGILSLMAIYSGKFIMEKVNRRLISYIAGAIFIVIGIIYCIGI